MLYIYEKNPWHLCAHIFSPPMILHTLFDPGQVSIRTFCEFYIFPYFTPFLGGLHKSVKSGFYCVRMHV